MSGRAVAKFVAKGPPADRSSIRPSSMANDSHSDYSGRILSTCSNNGAPPATPPPHAGSDEFCNFKSNEERHLDDGAASAAPESVAGVDEKLQRLAQAQAIQVELIRAEFEKLFNEKSIGLASSRVSDPDPPRSESPLYVSHRVGSPSTEMQSHRNLLIHLRRLLRDATTNIQSSRPLAPTEFESTAQPQGGRLYELMQGLRQAQESLKEETSKKNRLSGEVEKLEAKTTEMRAEVGHLMAQLEATRTQRTQLSSELQSHRLQINDLTEALSRERSVKVKVEGQVERIAQLQVELKALKNTLAEEQRTRQQLSAELDKFRKLEVLEAKRVTELSAEVVGLKSAIATAQLEKSQVAADLSRAAERVESLESQLVEAAALHQQALDELARVGSEQSRSLEYEQRLAGLSEALTTAQEENKKLADEIARLRDVQSVRTSELSREVRQLTDALKEEQLQKLRIQDEMARQRDGEGIRYEELTREVERLYASLQEEQTQKAQLAEELTQIREEAIRVAEASQETRGLREQLSKEQMQRANLADDLRRLQAVHDAEIATTIRLHEELRRIQQEFAQEQSLRAELAEKVHFLEIRKGSHGDLSAELRAENELLWGRLEEARAKEAQLADELDQLKSDMMELRQTEAGKILTELELTRRQLEEAKQQLEVLRSNDEVASEEGTRLLIESMNAQIDALMKDVAAGKSERTTMEASLKAALKQLREESEMRTLAEQIAEEKARLLEERSMELERRSAQLQSLAAQLQERSTQLEEARATLASLEAEHASLKESAALSLREETQQPQIHSEIAAELLDVKARLEAVESELRDTLAQKVKTEEEVVALRMELATTRTARKAQKAKPESVDVAVIAAPLEEKIRILTEENSRLSNECASHSADMEALRVRSAELEKELLSAQAELQGLRRSAEAAQKAIEEQIRGAVGASEQRLANALTTIEETEQALELARSQADGLARTIEARSDEQLALRDALQQKEREMQSLREELALREARRAADTEAIEKESEALRREAERAAAEATEKSEEVDVLRRGLQEANTRLQEIEEILKEKQLLLDSLQAQKEEAEGQNSSAPSEAKAFDNEPQQQPEREGTPDQRARIAVLEEQISELEAKLADHVKAADASEERQLALEQREAELAAEIRRVSLPASQAETMDASTDAPNGMPTGMPTDCEALRAQIAELQREKDAFAARAHELAEELESAERRLSALEGEKRQTEDKLTNVEAIREERDAAFVEKQRALQTCDELKHRIVDLEAKLEETSQRCGPQSSATASTVDTAESEPGEIDFLKVRLKETQLAFVTELQKLRDALIPNYHPRISPRTLPYSQRAFLTRIQELLAGNFEAVSVAALPIEKSLSARDLHVEVCRLEACLHSVREQLGTVQSEYEKSKEQLAKVEAGWKEEYRFYVARQQRLEADLEAAHGRANGLQRQLDAETAKRSEAERMGARPKAAEKAPAKPDQIQKTAAELKKAEKAIADLDKQLAVAEKEKQEALELTTMLRDQLNKCAPPPELLAENRFYLGAICAIIGLILGIIFI